MSDIDDELFALAGGDEDAEVEEGEASSVAASSPNSLGSDAMDESDSDRDDDIPTKDTDVPYPLEGKYIDAKDKSRINNLPQLERERILGERADEQSRAQFAAELARRAKGLEKASAISDRKRKASSLEPEDSQRKSSRQKVKGKTNDKLEAYKREREQRGQQRQRHDDRRNGRRRSSSASRDAESEIDAEGESDVEYADYSRATREEEPAQLNHFNHVQVTRGYFSEVCFFPGFEEAMTGTYARIGTGQDAQHRTLYKMALIKGFTTGRPYVFEGKNGQKLATDQYVLAQHGTVKKEYTFSYLSNQRFTENDLITFKESLAETNSKFPTEPTLRKKYDDMKALKERFWTDADINARIAKSKKYEHIISSRSTSDSQPKLPSASEREAQRIAELNAANRKADSERVRKALIEERRRDIQDRKRREVEWQKKKAEEEAKKKAEEEKAAQGIDDLFDSRAGTPRGGTPKPGEKKEKKKGLPTFRKPKMDDDIIAGMDLGLEIEI